MQVHTKMRPAERALVTLHPSFLSNSVSTDLLGNNNIM